MANMMSIAQMDLYADLQVSLDATQDDIKNAYRKIAKENHPDKTNGDSDKEEVFKKANFAYEILGSSEKRREYDSYRASLKSMKPQNVREKRPANKTANNPGFDWAAYERRAQQEYNEWQTRYNEEFKRKRAFFYANMRSNGR